MQLSKVSEEISFMLLERNTNFFVIEISRQPQIQSVIGLFEIPSWMFFQQAGDKMSSSKLKAGKDELMLPQDCQKNST